MLATRLLREDSQKNQRLITAAAGKPPQVFAWPYGAYPMDGTADSTLKALGIPVNDAENTDYYKPGTAGRRKMDAMVLAMAKTPLGRLCASDHAMHAVKEMQYLDEAFEALRKQAVTAMPMWEKLRNEMPAWNTQQK